MLLKVGRHLRPRPHYKIVIGREEGENNYLSGYRHDFPTIKTISHKGAFALVDGDVTDDDLRQAAIVARYSQGRDSDQVQTQITRPGQPVCGYIVTVAPMSGDEIPSSWYV